jgi:hypothetical protein
VTVKDTSHLLDRKISVTPKPTPAPTQAPTVKPTPAPTPAPSQDSQKYTKGEWSLNGKSGSWNYTDKQYLIMQTHPAAKNMSAYSVASPAYYAPDALVAEMTIPNLNGLGLTINMPGALVHTAPRPAVKIKDRLTGKIIDLYSTVSPLFHKSYASAIKADFGNMRSDLVPGQCARCNRMMALGCIDPDTKQEVVYYCVDTDLHPNWGMYYPSSGEEYGYSYPIGNAVYIKSLADKKVRVTSVIVATGQGNAKDNIHPGQTPLKNMPMAQFMSLVKTWKPNYVKWTRFI